MLNPARQRAELFARVRLAAARQVALTAASEDDEEEGDGSDRKDAAAAALLLLQRRKKDLGQIAKLFDGYADGTVTLATLRKAIADAGLPESTLGDLTDAMDRIGDVQDQAKSGGISAAQAGVWALNIAGVAHALWQQTTVDEANARPETVYLQNVVDPAAHHCDQCADIGDETRKSEDWEGERPGQRECGESDRCELNEVDGPNG